MKIRQSDRETQYRPQAGKTLQSALRRFITREFPRLGGPWVVNLLVDRLLQIMDQYQVAREAKSTGCVNILTSQPRDTTCHLAQSMD